MNIQELTSTLSHLEELRWKVSVDRYKYVCAAEGISERKAMDMYKHFQTLTEGRIPRPDHQEPTAEYLQRIVDMAERAKAEYSFYRHMNADLTNFNYQSWGDDFEYALYIFTKADEPTKAEEFNIASPDTYVSVALLLKGGWEMKHVIRQCDETSDTRRYLNFTEEERSNMKTLRIYDGDVFEVMPSNSIMGHASDCGMYLCHNGAYRKLIYIPGKGYIHDGKPLIDRPVQISIDKDGLFNSHMITWDGFRKVGNIHVDMGCLVEKAE